PTITAMATCTAPSQTNCLVPCPTCGNGVVEFPETCDTAGTPLSCDGCSVFCQIENPNCSDANVCTTDSCSPSLGCRHVSVADGTSCSDGNVCNGSERCASGTCLPGVPLNCSDNNACTLDPCDPSGGCQPHTPDGAGPAFTDNHAGNLSDTCDEARPRAGWPVRPKRRQGVHDRTRRQHPGLCLPQSHRHMDGRRQLLHRRRVLGGQLHPSGAGRGDGVRRRSVLHRERGVSRGVVLRRRAPQLRRWECVHHRQL